MQGGPGRRQGVIGLIAFAGCSVAAAAQTAAPTGGDGKPADAPAPPQITRSETTKSDNWLLTCVEFASGSRKRACTARLQINQKDSTNTVFIWEIGSTAERKVLSVMQFPSGVLIEPGLELQVGKSPARKFGYTSCEPSRCVVSFAVDERLMKDIAATPKVDAVVKAVNGSTITFQIETAGLDKVYPQIVK